MNRWEADRAAETQYRVCVEHAIARARSAPEDVWQRFRASVQSGAASPEAGPKVEQICLEVIRSCSDSELDILWFGSEALWKRDSADPGSRTACKESVLKELYERVKYAAGEGEKEGQIPCKAALEGGKAGRKPGPTVGTALHFHCDEDDLVFLLKVARKLAQVVEQSPLAPEDARAIRHTVGALGKLPEPLPDLRVQIEVTHRMGDDDFGETYTYVVKLTPASIEIASRGIQHDPVAGDTSFSLESLAWHAEGQVVQQGNRDLWLERMTYALAHTYTVKVLRPTS
jgi:plasmid stabilization system protein ParE